MSDPAISVRHLSKRYHLGIISRQTLVDEITYWWHKVRGRNPLDHMGTIGNNQKLSGDKPDSFWALKDISFDVQPGEVVGIIGRNGAGKSTLLKILSRITEPTEGGAEINGRVGALLEVGTGFHPELTGRENIYMNGTILGMKKSEIARKFDEIVAFSELEQFLDTPVKRYSSGMYVRLAFAVAAHLEPEILIVDEVLAVGDAAFQKKCLAKMHDVSHAGRTVIFVSHNMPAITRLCSRAILLDSGRLVMQGSADAVVEHYMEKSAEAGSSREWRDDEAPGTSELRLLNVTVMKKDGTPVTVAEVTDELLVRLTYRVTVPELRFRCLVAFCTGGMAAFPALEPEELCRGPAGVYSSMLHVPANLLAENEYTLNVSLFASRGRKMYFVRERGVVAFQIVDYIRGDSARGDYTETLYGAVRPKLGWETCCESLS